MIRSGFRHFVGFLMTLVAGAALPVGLGEIRGQPVIGEELRLQVDLLGGENPALDVSCFRLVKPKGIDDQPWLKSATLTLRGRIAPTLEIRSRAVLREPVLSFAVYLGCGYEMERSYTLFVSPAAERQGRLDPPRTQGELLPGPDVSPPKPAIRRPSVPKASGVARSARQLPSPSGLRSQSGGRYELRLSTEIDLQNSKLVDARIESPTPDPGSRMSVLKEEQVRAEEKLRNMEAAFVELEKRSAEFALRVEKEGAPEPRAESSVALQAAVAPTVSSWGLSKWGFYGVLGGGIVGLGGWLGWQAYRRRASALTADDRLVKAAGSYAEPESSGFLPGDIVVDVAPVVAQTTSEQKKEALAELPSVEPVFSSFDTTATLDEHFAANPVMELADIMLSFGRVKGAAQALQEFIDHNPHDALQPWIRLLDVYRMAGMRTEFDALAKNLNRHFNVEVQQWELSGKDAGEAVASGELSLQPVVGAQSLEDMPRLMKCVVDLWTSGDVVGYLYGLLRDNRGGQRLGFSLPVVEDILFLIELKETVNRME